MQKGGKLADASTFLAVSRDFFLDIFHVFFIVLPFFPVPPPTPAIFDESGQEAKTVVGPYMEGDSVVLKCISSGGEFQIQLKTVLMSPKSPNGQQKIGVNVCPTPSEFPHS